MLQEKQQQQQQENMIRGRDVIRSPSLSKDEGCGRRSGCSTHNDIFILSSHTNLDRSLDLALGNPVTQSSSNSISSNNNNNNCCTKNSISKKITLLPVLQQRNLFSHNNNSKQHQQAQQQQEQHQQTFQQHEQQVLLKKIALEKVNNQPPPQMAGYQQEAHFAAAAATTTRATAAVVVIKDYSQEVKKQNMKENSNQMKTNNQNNNNSNNWNGKENSNPMLSISVANDSFLKPSSIFSKRSSSSISAKAAVVAATTTGNGGAMTPVAASISSGLEPIKEQSMKFFPTTSLSYSAQQRRRSLINSSNHHPSSSVTDKIDRQKLKTYILSHEFSYDVSPEPCQQQHHHHQRTSRNKSLSLNLNGEQLIPIVTTTTTNTPNANTSSSSQQSSNSQSSLCHEDKSKEFPKVIGEAIKQVNTPSISSQTLLPLHLPSKLLTPIEGFRSIEETSKTIDMSRGETSSNNRKDHILFLKPILSQPRHPGIDRYSTINKNNNNSNKNIVCLSSRISTRQSSISSSARDVHAQDLVMQAIHELGRMEEGQGEKKGHQENNNSVARKSNSIQPCEQILSTASTTTTTMSKIGEGRSKTNRSTNIMLRKPALEAESSLENQISLERNQTSRSSSESNKRRMRIQAYSLEQQGDEEQTKQQHQLQEEQEQQQERESISIKTSKNVDEQRYVDQYSRPIVIKAKEDKNSGGCIGGSRNPAGESMNHEGSIDEMWNRITFHKLAPWQSKGDSTTSRAITNKKIRNVQGERLRYSLNVTAAQSDSIAAFNSNQNPSRQFVDFDISDYLKNKKKL